MTFTDTHCHLDFSDFDHDRDEVILRAHEAGVSRLISIGTCAQTSAASIELSTHHDAVYSAVGIHPCYMDQAVPEDIERIDSLCTEKKVVSIGECGLDYHRLPETGVGENILAQKTFFKKQLELAEKHSLPVVIHQRDSWDDCTEILTPYFTRLRTVFHCFSGTRTQAEFLVERGQMVSFTGIVTFKNAKELHAVAASVPDSNFMLETDCPYLAPAPHRGKRCEPAFVPHIAARVAELRGTSTEEVSKITESNVDEFFRFIR